MDESEAIALAIEKRLDLRIALGRVYDAQRKVAVAADSLRADLTLLGGAAIGERRTLASAGQDDANLRFNEGRYDAILGMDLPLERTAERNLYRNSLIGFEQVVRDLQETEDQIKFEIRNNLRALLEARETVRIQALSVKVAERRVVSTDLFLQAGRAEVRDVLEAQEALLSAQNALTAALVQYRVAELEMQRDLGLLVVDEKGIWKEFTPEETANDGD
jgi:outer membrane protein TolC